jgi:hypothetical protein
MSQAQSIWRNIRQPVKIDDFFGNVIAASRGRERRRKQIQFIIWKTDGDS